MKYVKVDLHNSGKYLGIQGPVKGVTVPEEIYNLMKFLGLNVELSKQTQKPKQESKQEETTTQQAVVENTEVSENTSEEPVAYTEKTEPEVDFTNIEIENQEITEEAFISNGEENAAELFAKYVPEETEEKLEINSEWYEYTEDELMSMKRTELRTLINKERGHERVSDPYHATKDEAKMSIIQKIIQEQEDRKLK